MCTVLQQKGFTLIETVLTFFYFILLVSFFPVLVTSLFEPVRTTSMEPIEVQLFFHELYTDLSIASNVSITRNGFIFDTPYQQRVSYDMYHHLIRRQVQGKGHDVRLQHVSSMDIKQTAYYLTVKVTGKDGEEYEKTFLYKQIQQ